MKVKVPTPKEMVEMVNIAEQFHGKTEEVARIYRFVFPSPSTPDSVECSMFGTFADIYEGLEVLSKQTDSTCQGIALTTCGWAVPLDSSGGNIEPNVPPSEHPARRRVSLTLVYNVENACGNVVKFTEGGTVIDEGEETASGGQLLDAVRVALHLHRANTEDIQKMIEESLAEVARLIDADPDVLG